MPHSSGLQLVYLVKPQMSSYYGFFLLYQASFCKMAGRCVCSLGMTKMFLCEMGWNGFRHHIFRTVERILFCVGFFLKRLAFSMSELSPQHRICAPARMFSCLPIPVASRRILCARAIFAFAPTRADVPQVLNKGKMFALLSTWTAWTQKASKFHSMTLRGCGWLHQSSIPSSLPPF